MAKKTGSDYIPTYAEIEAERAECDKRTEELRKKGWRLGEFEVKYKVNGAELVQKMASRSKIEVVEELKQQCGMVGWVPYDIEVKTLVEPNIYV